MNAHRTSPRRWPWHAACAGLGLATAAMLLDLAFPLPLPDARNAGAVVLALK